MQLASDAWLDARVPLFDFPAGQAAHLVLALPSAVYVPLGHTVHVSSGYAMLQLPYGTRSLTLLKPRLPTT